MSVICYLISFAGSRRASPGRAGRGVVAAPVSFGAIALVWYAPVTARFLVLPLATAHGVTIAWYAVASAALTLTCAAMRDQWHRYIRCSGECVAR